MYCNDYYSYCISKVLYIIIYVQVFDNIYYKALFNYCKHRAQLENDIPSEMDKWNMQPNSELQHLSAFVRSKKIEVKNITD